MQFQVDNSPVGPAVSLSNGTATSSPLLDLSVGDHDVTAVFTSTDNFSTSIGYLKQTVNQSSNVASSLSVTSTGLLYSRVTKLFSCNLTVTNSGATSISGPFVIWFENLTAGVSLVKGNGLLNGYPQISPATPTSLGAGQSFTVPLQFSDPTNARINFTPVVFYSGNTGN